MATEIGHLSMWACEEMCPEISTSFLCAVFLFSHAHIHLLTGNALLPAKLLRQVNHASHFSKVCVPCGHCMFLSRLLSC